MFCIYMSGVYLFYGLLPGMVEVVIVFKEGMR